MAGLLLEDWGGAQDKRAKPDQVRYVGRIPGRYSLPDRKSASGVSVFSCRTNGISPEVAAVSAPVSGKVGDPITANFDDLGLVKGNVLHVSSDGFHLRIDPDKTDVPKLASRIEWVKRRSLNVAHDNRRHKRFMPRNPNTMLVLADGSRLRCFVIDMSSSGVAISADLCPPVGTPLAVGSVVGRVVRQLAGGFAVQFIEEQQASEVERLLVRQQDDEQIYL